MKKIRNHLGSFFGAAAFFAVSAIFLGIAGLYVYVLFKQSLYFGTFMDWLKLALIVLLLMYVAFEMWRQYRYEHRDNPSGKKG